MSKYLLFHIPTIFLLLASIGLSITTLIENVWATDQAGTFTFGLVGYSQGKEWVAYLDDDRAESLVKAGSIQICLSLFGIFLNGFAIYALMLLLPWVQRFRRRRASAGIPIACCCGCGRSFARPSMSLSAMSPALSLIAAVTYIAATITWPLVGIAATEAFMQAQEQKEAYKVELGWCFALAILSALCSMGAGILSFFVIKFADLQTLSGTTENIAGFDQTSIRSYPMQRKKGGFDIESALASMEEDDEESEFACRRACSQDQKARSTKHDRIYSKGSSLIRNFFAKMTRTFRSQPSGEYNEVDLLSPKSPQLLPRPADVLNPFATHTDHSVDDYLVEASATERKDTKTYGASSAGTIPALVGKRNWRDELSEEDI
eukprot:CAMPEP_0184504360 /NCGR_PEP_ID=MMETSP0113_2-20130426/52425_1 /TAXON_ID=91329 /ORGANISM="Norrisiella sphaerica, Strain BC52" /LENGTH=375 /DNA_ID=CAMNT_0026894001 /DNA_START=69 /DNA_END=1196 /DNA_ORIENTATION=+